MRRIADTAGGQGARGIQTFRTEAPLRSRSSAAQRIRRVGSSRLPNARRVGVAVGAGSDPWSDLVRRGYLYAHASRRSASLGARRQSILIRALSASNAKYAHDREVVPLPAEQRARKAPSKAASSKFSTREGGSLAVTRHGGERVLRPRTSRGPDLRAADPQDRLPDGSEEMVGGRKHRLGRGAPLNHDQHRESVDGKSGPQGEHPEKHLSGHRHRTRTRKPI
jgi:hypothetical protein